MRVAVVGAGPVGIAAALGALRRGWDVTVYEREAVGASLRRWGPTRLFSPLASNLPPGAADHLPPFDDDRILTGPELADEVLVPLAEGPLAGRIVSAEVAAIGRAGWSRGEHAGHPLRGERPFRLLLDGPGGERTVDADVVLDASGLALPCAFGAGGLPAIGERALGDRVIRELGRLAQEGAALVGRRVLLVGHGHSAANAVSRLEALAEAGTTVVWATRSAQLRPCLDVASDPLPERKRVVVAANALAARPPAWLRVERRASVEAVEIDGSAIGARLTGDRVVTVDAIVALTGRRPDPAPLSELAVEISPATEGAARLSAALANVTDCLSVPTVPPSALASGEPGFHLVGSRAYGRSRTFLLRTGYAQVEAILDGLGR